MPVVNGGTYWTVVVIGVGRGALYICDVTVMADGAS